jgi:predicted helicase
VDRYKREKSEHWPKHIQWDSSLKLNLLRGQYAEFDPKYIIQSLYRPFGKRWLYFNRVVISRVCQWPNISGRSMCITAHSQVPFSVQASDAMPNEAAGGRQGQCFPLSYLKDSAVEQFRKHYADDSIAKEDIFHYIYALLHHPGYRERYAANLKRELPRIPFAPDFAAFAAAGKELARLHVEYESLAPWPLQEEETKGVAYSQRVEKMKLSADKQSLQVNESLTLRGIPAEVFEYRLGSRSALEWVIDQYQVKGASDPNREDDPGYIVRLIGQVVRVSVATVQIVRSLPNYR